MDMQGTMINVKQKVAQGNPRPPPLQTGLHPSTVGSMLRFRRYKYFNPYVLTNVLSISLKAARYQKDKINLTRDPAEICTETRDQSGHLLELQHPTLKGCGGWKDVWPHVAQCGRSRHLAG